MALILSGRLLDLHEALYQCRDCHRPTGIRVATSPPAFLAQGIRVAASFNSFHLYPSLWPFSCPEATARRPTRPPPEFSFGKLAVGVCIDGLESSRRLIARPS